MDTTGFDEAIFTPAGVAFIQKVEEQVRTAPHAGTPHTFPLDIGGIERDFIAQRFALVSHYTVTRTPSGLVVIVPDEDD